MMEGLFDSTSTEFGHIVVSGKSNSGKTELTKQVVGSVLQTEKKVLYFSTDTAVQDWLFGLNGKLVMSELDVNDRLFSENKLVIVNSTCVNFEQIKNLLLKDESEWLIVHEDFDEVSINYEQSEYMTQKLDFLYFVSEFGRVFNLYSMITCKDLRELSRVLPAKKMIDNSPNLIFLQQEYVSLKHARKNGWLTELQEEKVKNLLKYEAFFVQR